MSHTKKGSLKVFFSVLLSSLVYNALILSRTYYPILCISGCKLYAQAFSYQSDSVFNVIAKAVFTIRSDIRGENEEQGWCSGSYPGVDAICGLSLLLVLSFAPRRFSPGTPVFPSPQKPTFPNSNSTRNHVDEQRLCGCAISKSFFIYFIYLFKSNINFKR